MSTYVQAFGRFSRNVRLVLIVAALQGFAFFGVYSLLLNLYLLRLGYGPDFIGQVNAVGPLAMAVASVPAGVFGRRYGSRVGLIVGIGLMAIGLCLLPLNTFLPAQYQQVWILGAYAWAWFYAGLFVVNLGPFMMGSTSPGERNHAFAVQIATFPLFGFLGSLVGGTLPGMMASLTGSTMADPAPYQLALLLAGAITLLEAPILLRAQDVRDERIGQAARRAGGSALPLVVILVVGLVWMLRMGSEWIMRIFVNVYLDTALATPTALIGVLMAAGQLLGLAALGAPAAIARFGKQRTIILGTIGMALAFLPLVLMAQWLAVGLGYMVLFAAASLSGPAYSVYSQEIVAPQWRTTISSVMTLGMGLGVAIVAFGGSNVIEDYGYPSLFALGALLATAAALLFWAYFRKPRSALVAALPETAGG